MKPYVRMPHSRKFLELEKLIRKTKPTADHRIRAAFLIAWLMKRHCNYWIWCMKEGLCVYRPCKAHIDLRLKTSNLVNPDTKWWPNEILDHRHKRP